tara:strand:+ start:134 stop:295 length:162 start_codon:yes stop_codon:yes gene_type:complete
MNKKIVGIWYRYDDMTIDYIDNVKEISATSVISFIWFSTALTKLKIYWKKNNA